MLKRKEPKGVVRCKDISDGVALTVVGHVQRTIPMTPNSNCKERSAAGVPSEPIEVMRRKDVSDGVAFT